MKSTLFDTVSNEDLGTPFACPRLHRQACFTPTIQEKLKQAMFDKIS